MMTIEVLKSKLHRIEVTQANLNYIGSITIDELLMEAAGMYENERVYIYNLNNGERFDTYVIPGEKGSGIVGINGAAARKAEVGDLLIVVAYARITTQDLTGFRPMIAFPKDNKVTYPIQPRFRPRYDLDVDLGKDTIV